MNDMKLLDATELSKILHRTVRTIQADATRRPESLPPRMQIPGTRKLLWLETDVAEWLRKFSTSKTSRIR